MALPTKKRDFRPIVVDNVKYQWRFNGVLTVFADSPSSKRGQKLIADWGWMDWLEPEYKDAVPFDPHVVTPSFVRSAIQYAVSVGWQPSEPGVAFHISYAENQFQTTPKAT